MEEVLLSILGGGKATRSPRPRMALSEVDTRTRYLRSNAIERSTSNGYATGARDYINFCLNHELPIDPTPETLSRYLAYTSQYISSGPKYLSGARHFLAEFFPSFDVNRSHPLVQATIAGAKKVRADPVKRKLPLRQSHLVAFVNKARGSGDYDDFLFAVIISCCFYACHRSGELIWSNNKKLQDWRKVIKRASLHFDFGRAGYRLPYHKTDRFYRGTDILFTSQYFADPTVLLKDYASMRDSLHGCKAALFLRENGAVPTRSWFDSKFFSLLDRQYGGHSCRAGGATFYASLGLSEDIIQALGRWSSQAWKDYIRDNPAIRAELQLSEIRLRLNAPASR